MPPKQSTSASARASGPAKSSKSAAAASSFKTARDVTRAPGRKPPSKKTTAAAPAVPDFEDLSDLDPFADSVEEGEPPRAQPSKQRGREKATAMDIDDDDDDRVEEANEEEDDDDEAPKTIPPDLLTRLLHEFFEKDGTRISKDANAAVAKYMDVFVRESIARTAVERESGFLEVQDLEKVAPQLLLDL
ncbi:hypothetical protein UCREL1_11160 [Eutypa lata UCREL1]|uniref:Uncharacterized protein n=1 Tax=Eutypa lata (strain UCR-EL1) TaxID=1287681 RepID=M7SCJ7_EUTLA|nr:hypothetical protein UCREL1_11160 [Eutypa lata UCREL1]